MKPAMEGKIKKIIAKQLHQRIKDVKDDAKLIEDFGANELDLIELVLMLEELLSIRIPDEYPDRWLTVGDIIKTFSDKLNLR